MVLQFLKSIIDPLLNRFQFVSRENMYVDDAVCLGLFYVVQHLDSPNTYARVHSVEYSCTFNTSNPVRLFEKIDRMPVSHNPCVCRSSVFY